MLKPSYRPLNGQLVDFGWVDARIDRPAIKVMLRGCASSPSSAINAMAARTGRRAGRRRRREILPHHLQELNQVVNEGAEIEAASARAHRECYASR